MLAAALTLPVAACSAPQHTQLDLEEMVGYSVNSPAGDVDGSVFAKSLHMEYYELGKYEGLQGDYNDAVYFWQRSNEIDGGVIPAPTELGERDVKNNSDLIKGRAALMRLLDKGTQSEYPETTAYAQAMFDCWAEQSEESYQTYDIEDCSSRFWTALRSLENKKPAPRKPDVVISAFDVFFALDKYNLTDKARTVLKAVPSQLEKFKAGKIVITGYTDTSGAKDHNMTLSLKRAESVAAYLRMLGINSTMIEVRPMGEDNPPVPTADGVVNQSNRTAQVRFVK